MMHASAQHNAGGKDFIEGMNPNSLKVVIAKVEPSLAAARATTSSSLSATAALWRIGWIMRMGNRCLI